MGFVGSLQLLARRRWLVLAGVVVATLVAVSTLYHVSALPPRLESRAHSSGVATGRALLTADDGPAFDLGSKISITLPARASLIADLAATDAARAAIARRARVDPHLVVISGPAAGPPAVPVPIAVEATDAATGRGTYALTVSAAAADPLISVRATGPDAVDAARLADATRVEIAEIVRSRAGRRPAVSLTPLGPVSARTLATRPQTAIAVVAGMFVLALWCAGVALAPRLPRRRPPARRASA